MNIEELMKPRFKVIADYPGSPYQIDEVKQCADKDFGSVNFYKLFPHIFKKLEWWEERKIEDMPLYVKFFDNSIHKVLIWDMNIINEWIAHNKNPEGNDFLQIEWHFGKKKSEPSTKEEYEAYINSKK